MSDATGGLIVALVSLLLFVVPWICGSAAEAV